MKMWKKKLDKWREEEITAEEAIKKNRSGQSCIYWKWLFRTLRSYI